MGKKIVADQIKLFCKNPLNVPKMQSVSIRINLPFNARSLVLGERFLFLINYFHFKHFKHIM